MAYEVSMLCKTRLLLFLFFSVIWVSNTTLAHSPSYSNIIISKLENGQVILQINSSLTAFHQEVDYINGESAYASPEEFQNLVLDHFKSRFSFIVNKKDTLRLHNPKVFLDHETKIVAELLGLPEKINAIYIRNKLFKDINNSQSVVIFLLNGFPKEKFTLHRDNDHQTQLDLEDGMWKEPTLENHASKLKFIPFLITLIIGGFLNYIFDKMKANQ